MASSSNSRIRTMLRSMAATCGLSSVIASPSGRFRGHCRSMTACLVLGFAREPPGLESRYGFHRPWSTQRSCAAPRTLTRRQSTMATDRTPHDRYVDADGLRLHYLDWGNDAAPPMLLLHGFSGHAHTWDTFAR